MRTAEPPAAQSTTVCSLWQSDYNTMLPPSAHLVKNLTQNHSIPLHTAIYTAASDTFFRKLAFAANIAAILIAALLPNSLQLTVNVMCIYYAYCPVYPYFVLCIYCPALLRLDSVYSTVICCTIIWQT